MEYNNGDQIWSRGTVYTVIGKSPRGEQPRIVVAYQPTNGGWSYTDYGKDFLDNFFESVPQEFEAGKTYRIKVGSYSGNTFQVFAVEGDTAYGILEYKSGEKVAADRKQYRYSAIVESVVDDDA